MLQDDFYKRYGLAPQVRSLSVASTGHQHCIPGYQWGPGVLDHYCLYHILSGHGNLLLGERHFLLEAGDSFLVYPDTTVQFYAEQAKPWEYVWVGFSGSDARELVEQTDFRPDYPILLNVSSKSLGRMLLELHREERGSLACHVASTGRLYLIFALLSEKAQQSRRTPPPRTDCARMAARYIMNNYEQPITVEGLAELFSVSPSSLYRSFTTHFQVSPKRFLMEYRIQKACAMLVNSSFSVREISHSVGFHDALYFSRAFKQVMGLSPQAYAKRYRTAEPADRQKGNTD